MKSRLGLVGVGLSALLALSGTAIQRSRWRRRRHLWKRDRRQRTSQRRTVARTELLLGIATDRAGHDDQAPSEADDRVRAEPVRCPGVTALG